MKAWKQKTWQHETTGLDGKCQFGDNKGVKKGFKLFFRFFR